MTDVRSLLRAKRQVERVSHPYATYNSIGQLRCAVCSIPIKHVSAWEGHIGSKAHRMNVAKAKEQDRLREKSAKGKRKADFDEENNTTTDSGSRPSEEEHKKPRTEIGFPADFFSDANHQYEQLPEDNVDGNSSDVPKPAPSTVDLELAAFRQSLLEDNIMDESKLDTYASATVFAEPEIFETAADTGFPPEGEPTVIDNPKDEDEARKQREEEERELIMDRLLDEERAQEEADARVSSLKARLEATRKLRENKRQAKAR